MSGLPSIIDNVRFFDNLGLRIGPCASAMLADESNPDGDVVVYDRHGEPRLAMPVSVWEELRVWSKDHPDGQIHVGPSLESDG
jgi:hypothetical protein